VARDGEFVMSQVVASEGALQRRVAEGCAPRGLSTPQLCMLSPNTSVACHDNDIIGRRRRQLYERRHLPDAARPVPIVQ